jgi:glycosyltransferase involved in cell wall biosynthesis
MIPASLEAHSASPVKRQIRVLILIPSLAVGGAETDLVRTLPKIDRSRFAVTVCTFLERGELGKILEEQGIKVIGPLSISLHPLRQFLLRILQEMKSLLPLDAVGGWFKSVRALFSVVPAVAYLLEVTRLARPIARHIREYNIDVVHTILPNSYLVGAWASVLAGRRPLLMSRLSLNLYQQEYKLISFIERRILHRTVDAAIGNSSAVLQDLKAEGLPESKLHLVYNGIDAQAFTDSLTTRATARRSLRIPDSTLVFSVVANLHPYKGHRDLLQALAMSSSILQPDWLCLLVGGEVRGEQRELQRLCADHGLARNVIFLGPRSDVPFILSASDIHISGSHQEGFPNNILEAMCARLPVVATAVGGVPELVADGETGYLVPAQDARRMSEALVTLAQAPMRRRAFGEAGYAKALSSFGINNNVAALETIYTGLAGKVPKGRIKPSIFRKPNLHAATV